MRSGNVTTTKSDRSRSMSGQIVKKPTVYPSNDVNWGHFLQKIMSVPLNERIKCHWLGDWCNLL